MGGQSSIVSVCVSSLVSVPFLTPPFRVDCWRKKPKGRELGVTKEVEEEEEL